MEPGDAFGTALRDALTGERGTYIVERDDGWVEALDGAEYFAGPDEWPHRDRAALDLVGGRVLDVGAGAGRIALALRDRGDQPVALDVSPGAIDVCRARGLTSTYLGTVEQLAEEHPEGFDAAVMMGNNLALLESEARSAEVLDALRSLLEGAGVVVGTCLDPYRTDDPSHLAYHARNRERGRLPGQIRMRTRRHRLAGPWFDYLFVSRDELRALCTRAGWRLEDATEPDPVYLAVLRPV